MEVNTSRRVFSRSARFWYPPSAASFVLIGFAARLPLEDGQSRTRLIAAATIVVVLLWAMVLSFRFLLVQRFGRWTSIALISTATTVLTAVAAKFQGGCSQPASNTCSVQDSWTLGVTLGVAPVLVYLLFAVGIACFGAVARITRYVSRKIGR